MSHDNMANGVDGAQLSSCMTNQLGALESRFDYCDLNDLVGKLFSIAYETIFDDIFL